MHGVWDCVGFTCHNAQAHVQRISPNFESVSRGFGLIIRMLLGKFAKKSPGTGLNHDVEMTLISYMVLIGAYKCQFLALSARKCSNRKHAARFFHCDVTCCAPGGYTIMPRYLLSYTLIS